MSPAGGSETLDNKLADSEAQAKECDDLESRLASVKASYEQHFLGLERQPPTSAHNELKRRLGKLKGSVIRQTALKFRVQSLQNKLLTYERLWQRTIQEMENGVYRRDVFKAKMHQKARAAPSPSASSPPSSTVEAPAASPPVSEARLKAVFQAYLTAKKRCAEDTSRLSYESWSASLKKQMPELLKKHSATGVDFKVVIKDGKVILRALPKSA